MKGKKSLENYFPEYQICYTPRTKVLEGGVAICIKLFIKDLSNVLMENPDTVVFLLFL